MRFGEFWSHDLKCTMVQVNKKKAEKLFNAGKDVYFKANKMRFDSPWGTTFAMNSGDGQWDSHIGITAFENACNHFSNYNCNNYSGKYIQFFVKKSDLS